MGASRRAPAPNMSAMFDVFVLAQAVKDLLDEALAGAPLAPEDYAVYSQVLEVPGSTPTQLAQALSAPLTTVSDWLRTMRTRGHLVNRASMRDRRSYGVDLTVAGRRAHRETGDRFNIAYERFLAGLPTPEADLRQALIDAADAARSALRAIAAETRAPAS